MTDSTAESVARVPTDRPGRYAKQLVSHMSRRSEGSWDDTGVGKIIFYRCPSRPSKRGRRTTPRTHRHSREHRPDGRRGRSTSRPVRHPRRTRRRLAPGGRCRRHHPAQDRGLTTLNRTASVSSTEGLAFHWIAAFWFERRGHPAAGPPRGWQAGLNDHDTNQEWGLHWPPVGTLFMATDTALPGWLHRPPAAHVDPGSGGVEACECVLSLRGGLSALDTVFSPFLGRGDRCDVRPVG